MQSPSFTISIKRSWHGFKIGERYVWIFIYAKYLCIKFKKLKVNFPVDTGMTTTMKAKRKDLILTKQNIIMFVIIYN